jgi:Tfp pilus assembly protein PilN
MTILVQGRPVYWRTARLPRAAAAEELAERLTQEIRRTLAVAGQDIQPPVERVCLFARDSAHALLRDRIKHDLGLPAEPLNPFAAVEIEAELVPEHAGRFAAALGMVLDQAHGVRHAMDFLHPRRAPRQMTRAKFAAIGAAAVLTIAALLGNMFWRQRGELDSVIAELTAELKEYDGITSQVGQQRRVTDALLNWQAGDIYWLEELRELSERFPPAEESVILRMSISASPDGGHIALQGMMRDPAQIARMELALRDAHHGIRSRRIQEGARQDQQYKCLFDAAIAVAKRTREQYLPEQGRKP